MKVKKITRQELTPGMLVALTDHADSAIYILGEQHEDTGCVWQLLRQQRGRLMSCGWADYTTLFHPTKKQLTNDHNAPMISRFQAMLVETV